MTMIVITAGVNTSEGAFFEMPQYNQNKALMKTTTGHPYHMIDITK